MLIYKLKFIFGIRQLNGCLINTISGPGVAVGLYSRIKANDEQALRVLYTQNYPRAEKFILENSGSVEDAKDVYQEAFLATWRNVQLDKFTADHEHSIHSYLFQVTKNKWLDVLRTRKRKKTVNMPGSELPEDISVQDPLTADAVDYIEQVKAHYLVMGSPCKEVLEMFYFRKESLRNIAAFFSWTEATAKNNKYRLPAKIACIGAGYKRKFVTYNRQMTTEELEQIERFLRQEMDAGESAAFSRRIQDDVRLRDAVEEVRLLLLAIGEAGLQQRLHSFHEAVAPAANGRSASRSMPLKMNWGIAAGVALLIALSTWWLFSADREQKLYSSYYTPDPGLMTAMSSTNDDYDFEKAMVEYKNGDYNSALQAWQQLLKERPANDTLLYFIGAASQGRQDYANTIAYLEKVANNANSAFQKEASWYLGLAYLRTGQNEKALQYIRISDHPQRDQLINKLEKK